MRDSAARRFCLAVEGDVACEAEEGVHRCMHRRRGLDGRPVPPVRDEPQDRLRVAIALHGQRGWRACGPLQAAGEEPVRGLRGGRGQHRRRPQGSAAMGTAQASRSLRPPQPARDVALRDDVRAHPRAQWTHPAPAALEAHAAIHDAARARDCAKHTLVHRLQGRLRHGHVALRSAHRQRCVQPLSHRLRCPT